MESNDLNPLSNMRMFNVMDGYDVFEGFLLEIKILDWNRKIPIYF